LCHRKELQLQSLRRDRRTLELGKNDRK
jgi:hypothetical protein